MEVRRQKRKCVVLIVLWIANTIYGLRKKNRDKVECSKCQSLIFFLITKWMSEQFCSRSLGNIFLNKLFNKIYQMEVPSNAWHWVILLVFILIILPFPCMYLSHPCLPGCSALKGVAEIQNERRRKRKSKKKWKKERRRVLETPILIFVQIHWKHSNLLF